MPSSSSPRGARVVQEMEYVRSGYSCKSMSIRVDLPHPDGALITIKSGLVFIFSPKFCKHSWGDAVCVGHVVADLEERAIRKRVASERRGIGTGRECAEFSRQGERLGGLPLAHGNVFGGVEGTLARAFRGGEKFVALAFAETHVRFHGGAHHLRRGGESAFRDQLVAVRDEPVACGDGNGDAMFLPDGRPAVALLVAVLDVVMDQRRLVEALYRVLDGRQIPLPAAGIEHCATKARPQFLATAPHELDCDFCNHFPNTSIST